MITSVVFCPHPPLLLPRLAGRVDAGAPLRERCVSMLREAWAEGADVVAVVYGAPRGGPAWGQEVAAVLLRQAGVAPSEVVEVPVACTARPAQVAGAVSRLNTLSGRVLLLVMGDGSARRSDASPGLPDAQAQAFDAALAQAVGSGAPDALGALPGAGRDAELMIGGRAAFTVAGRALAGRSVTAVTCSVDDEFGVFYVLGRWRCGS